MEHSLLGVHALGSPLGLSLWMANSNADVLTGRKTSSAHSVLSITYNISWSMVLKKGYNAESPGGQKADYQLHTPTDRANHG